MESRLILSILYQVDNEHYGSVKLIKSIAVTDGRFAYPTDSIQVGLYCFSLQNMERGEYLQQYANLFFWNPNPCSLP